MVDKVGSFGGYVPLKIEISIPEGQKIRKSMALGGGGGHNLAGQSTRMHFLLVLLTQVTIVRKK